MNADKIKFKKPAFLNDEIEIRGTIIELGAVKLVLQMEVVVNPDKECQKVVEGIFTFVELDNNMRPTRIHYPSHSDWFLFVWTFLNSFEHVYGEFY